jgi:hypothetical protein
MRTRRPQYQLWLEAQARRAKVRFTLAEAQDKMNRIVTERIAKAHLELAQRQGYASREAWAAAHPQPPSGPAY